MQPQVYQRACLLASLRRVYQFSAEDQYGDVSALQGAMEAWGGQGIRVDKAGNVHMAPEAPLMITYFKNKLDRGCVM
eukprot:1387684-Pyramimonas_sp.AAC.1